MEAFGILKRSLPLHRFWHLQTSTLQIILDTEDSRVAKVAALTYKKEKGMINPVLYASCTINSAKKNYSASKREAFAVIFALQNFRVHLLSTNPFKLATDHQTLRCNFKKNDILGNLAR